MGWEVTSVGDEIDFLTSGSRGWAKYYAEDGDTFIRTLRETSLPSAGLLVILEV